MIFILGGNGFVGSALARYCRRRELAHEVITRENYAAFVGRSCDVLVNANGNSRKFLAAQQPLEEFDASVRSVRASLVNFPAGHYVHLSSCDVYPDCSSPEATQEEQSPDVSRQSPYGFHKYLAEQCVRHQAPRWLVLRMGGFVGPGMKKNPIFDILQGGPLWLDPASRLQFLHTDALAEIVFQLIQQQVHGQVLNACGAGLIELREVLEAAGGAVAVRPGSPTVRYDVSIRRLQAYVSVPSTRPTVLEFVARARAERAAEIEEPRQSAA